jgi:hypothetical protein
MKLILILTFLMMACNSFATGLTGGDQFSAVAISGQLSVQCMGSNPGTNYGTAYCQSELLNPGEYSYFTGPNIDADSVTLQATWPNGKVSKSKTEKYNSTTGKSVKSFNLWISTLLQRPLLSYGKNIVRYVLSKNGNKVEEGIFNVEVTTGETKRCQRSGFYTSNDNNDCVFPQNLCNRYFAENNYCE